MRRIVYLDGSYVPLNRAKVSILAPGFLYGWGLFETIRVYNGKVFLLSRHLKRLFDSAKKIDLRIPFSQKTIFSAVKRTVELNGLDSASVRLTVWLGTHEKGEICIVAQPYKPPKGYHKGWRAILLDIRKSTSSLLNNIKSSCFLENILARKEAQRKGCEEGIFLNTDNEVTEGTVSNLFAVKGNTVFTPSLQSNILPGITRGLIFTLAGELNIKIREGRVYLKELMNADEAFLTNSLIEVMPLVSIDGRKIGKGRPGQITRRLHNAYKNYVKRLIE